MGLSLGFQAFGHNPKYWTNMDDGSRLKIKGLAVYPVDMVNIWATHMTHLQATIAALEWQW